jgi:hypothetical protein
MSILVGNIAGRVWSAASVVHDNGKYYFQVGPKVLAREISSMQHRVWTGLLN